MFTLFALQDTDMVKSGCSAVIESGIGPSSTTLGATKSAKYGISAGPENEAGPSTTTVGAANVTGQSQR